MEFKTTGYNREPGAPYRPTNGTEGEAFYDAVCAGCRNDDLDNCSIIAYAMAFNIGDEEYPKEWIINKNGNPSCSAFECRYTGGGMESASLPGYRCDRTNDLFRGEENEKT